ncbi:MAG: diaminopimelate epimerase [Actinomycetota bacterium]|nr:diaminopimelate epimerase [Actinomycetota bacterium]
MKKIEFSKLNGQGNDFILIDATVNRIKLSGDQIIRMCDRNFGIGADGLILVRPSKISDLKMDLYNKDGSVAEMSGNGIRCMARFAYENNLVNKKNKNFSIETLSGIKKIFLSIEGGKVRDIKVDMGFPEFKPENIPVNMVNSKADEIFNHKIKIDSKDFIINCISMGNPHCVIFLNNNVELDTFPVGKLGPKIENHRFFPNKTNVEFVRTSGNEELNIRIWERGVGETLACGTGACAAAVCAVKLEKVKKNKVIVNVQGGKLNIIWDPRSNIIYLKGKVEHNFDGQYYL